MNHRRVNCNNISENFDEKEWKNTLKNAHDFAVSEGDKVKQQIENIIKDVDPVELLLHLSLLSQFIPEGEPESNQDLRDKPTLHFLVGLCLKSENLDNRPPDNQEVSKIIELLDKYFIYFSQGITFQSVKKKQVSEVDELILLAKLQNMISQINSNGYLERLSASCTLKGSVHRYLHMPILGSVHRIPFLINQTQRSNLCDCVQSHRSHSQIS